MDITATFLEILKYTLPSIIVFYTVSRLFNGYLMQQIRLKNIETAANQNKTIMPLKIQAYERLILFCERIDPFALYLRLNSNGMDAEQLKHTMLIAIKQEFDYNLPQQLYVSEELWKIIKLTKDQMSNLIDQTEAENTGQLMERINMAIEKAGVNSLEMAKMAIKKELDSYLPLY